MSASSVTYVVRRAVAAEWYGASLLAAAGRGRVLETGPIAAPTDEILALERPFLVGAYFKEHLDKFKAPVIMFVQDDEKVEARRGLTVVRAQPALGFASYAAGELKLTDYRARVASYLDAYQYGWLEDDAPSDFQHGMYTLEGKTVQEKLTKVTADNIDAAVDIGGLVRVANARVVANRVAIAVPYLVALDPEVSVEALVANGDAPIVESCAALARASKGGVGILVRYNFGGQTLISVRVTRESGLSAGAIAAVLCRAGGGSGGGSRAMGGGSFGYMWTPSAAK